MNSSPILRQLFVAIAPQLAAISAGGIVSFPGVLFPQLKAIDSTIQVDVDTSSWIGSTHGLAGGFACLMPLFMQYKGRKLSFMLSCILSFIGWIIIYLAQSADTLIAAEVFHGIGSNSLLICGLSTTSEMVHPKFRIILMNLYMLGQTFGMSLIIFIGRHISWRTVALIECCPIIVALLICLVWPESPAWLAYKGQYIKCEAAFKWLRGRDADSDKELHELIKAQKEAIAKRKPTSSLKFNKKLARCILLTLMQRDFYMPCIHSFMLLNSIYWSGLSVVLIYTTDMLLKVTGSESSASVGLTVVFALVLIGNALGMVISKKIKNKTIIITGITSAGLFMTGACVVSYLQENEILPQDSLLCMYCLIGYTASFSLGTAMTITSTAAELIPIKHRGIGGVLYIIYISLLEFSSMKLSPYLFLYINIWGTFLVYAVNAALCSLFVWRHVPETKKRTLQEIEDFYNHGHFVERCSDENGLENIIS